jgi:HSP20 family protein
MTITDLIPWKRQKREVAPSRSQDEWLNDMNRLFDGFFGRGAFGSLAAFAGEAWGTFYPQVDIEESDKEIIVSAELPGIDRRDIDITVSRNVLTIRGEKRDERENTRKNYTYTERSYGSFERSVALPTTVKGEKAQAKFDKGVLTITLPKTAPSKSPRRIAVKVR